MSPSSKDQESTMKVYVATHCRNDEELGSRKIIGIFSSQESAHAAVDAISEELEEARSRSTTRTFSRWLPTTSTRCCSERPPYLIVSSSTRRRIP